MSLKYQQYRSLKWTRALLFRLMSTDRPKSVKELKKEVSICLKHFPALMETGEPIFSDDNILASEEFVVASID